MAQVLRYLFFSHLHRSLGIGVTGSTKEHGPRSRQPLIQPLRGKTVLIGKGAALPISQGIARMSREETNPGKIPEGGF